MKKMVAVAAGLALMLALALAGCSQGATDEGSDAEPGREAKAGAEAPVEQNDTTFDDEHSDFGLTYRVPASWTKTDKGDTISYFDPAGTRQIMLTRLDATDAYKAVEGMEGEAREQTLELLTVGAGMQGLVDAGIASNATTTSISGHAAVTADLDGKDQIGRACTVLIDEESYILVTCGQSPSVANETPDLCDTFFEGLSVV